MPASTACLQRDPVNPAARLTEVACWAHARRKLYEVHERTASPLAREALERIADLFVIERADQGSCAAGTLGVRQRVRRPAARRAPSVSATLPLSQIQRKEHSAKAIRYARRAGRH